MTELAGSEAPAAGQPGTVVGQLVIHAEATVIRDGKVVPPDEDEAGAAQ
jgi:hypothetical protein